MPFAQASWVGGRSAHPKHITVTLRLWSEGGGAVSFLFSRLQKLVEPEKADKTLKASEQERAQASQLVKGAEDELASLYKDLIGCGSAKRLPAE